MGHFGTLALHDAAVRVVNRMLGAVNLDKHSDQTFIDRIERGFRRSQCFSRGSMTNKKTTKPEKATRASVIKNVSMT
jgi:hypothetical protein